MLYQNNYLLYFWSGLGFNPLSLQNVLEHELQANLDNMLRRFGPSPQSCERGLMNGRGEKKNLRNKKEIKRK